MSQIIKAGLYMRLSREDENAPESESIANQKTLLTKYARDMDWTIEESYIDDGYTGTNFQRPGFQKMLRDIQRGKINCVLTKDLSRLGRDYIETGYYLEKFFPENNIRYIAICDGIDTCTASALSDITPFRAVINDMYARDISKKVRAALNAKRSAGEFIGAFAPYGYRKDPQNKNRLVVEEETAVVVRRIYGLYLQGLGCSQIAAVLTGDGIATPSAAKGVSTGYRNPRAVKNGKWTPETIRRILRNPTYAGDLTQGMERKISYKLDKKAAVPREQWVVVPDTHEGLVDRHTFEAVQELMGRDITHQKKRSHLLTGILYCGDCGARMTYSTYKTASGEHKTQYVCSGYKRHSKCTRHAVNGEELEERIRKELMSHAASVDVIALKKASWRQVKAKNMRSPRQTDIAALERRQREISGALKELYIDKVRGVLGEADFHRLKEALGEEAAQLESRLQRQQAAEKPEEAEGTDSVAELLSSGYIERDLLISLIEKIEVYEETGQVGKIRIYYSFRNPYPYDMQCSLGCRLH